jgi:RNA polymerase sigma factor (sigma-70 family)
MGKTMSDDMKLLREYADSRSEAAFSALVSRHLNLVHSAALRKLRDPHLAEDVTQTVFTLLARKVNSIGPNTVLTGWLYRTTLFAAADALRAHRRRQIREHQAYMQSSLAEPQAEAAWQQLCPLLDDGMSSLAQADRDALLLRYFENKSLSEVATHLGTTEEAAKKRVARGLEKLRAWLSKRGLTLTATVIAGAVAANAVKAAPLGLASKIAAAALAGIALTATTAITMTTLQKAIIAAALAAAVGTAIYQAKQTANARAAVQALEQQQAPLVEQIQQLQEERDKGTNTIAWLTDGLARASSNNVELLKLRREVAVLRRQLSDGKQPTPTPADQPRDVNATTNDLLVAIASVQADGQPQPFEVVTGSHDMPPVVRREVTIPAGAENIEIHFSTPGLDPKIPIHIWYLLTGSDNELNQDGWSGDNLGRVAKYSELPPGSYTFEVKAVDVDGVLKVPAGSAIQHGHLSTGGITRRRPNEAGSAVQDGGAAPAYWEGDVTTLKIRVE